MSRAAETRLAAAGGALRRAADAASHITQSAVLPVSGKARGTYVYAVEFRNAAGATTSKPITVTVAALSRPAAPGATQPPGANDEAALRGTFSLENR